MIPNLNDTGGDSEQFQKVRLFKKKKREITDYTDGTKTCFCSKTRNCVICLVDLNWDLKEKKRRPTLL